jgi:hypothetical protein
LSIRMGSGPRLRRVILRMELRQAPPATHGCRAGPSPQCRFRAASLPRGVGVHPWMAESRRMRFLNGGHLEDGWGRARGRGRGSGIMRDAPLEAVWSDRGLSGMWGMRERPRSRGPGSSGPSCMLRGAPTRMGERHTPAPGARRSMRPLTLSHPRVPTTTARHGRRAEPALRRRALLLVVARVPLPEEGGGAEARAG